MTALHAAELSVFLTTAAYIAAEIKLDYSVGDKVKDLFLKVVGFFKKAKAVEAEVAKKL